LTTSSAAANRQVAWWATDGTNYFFQMYAPSVQTAGTANLYEITQAPVSAKVGLVQISPMPSFILREGYNLFTVTTNIDTGDQWSSIQVFLEEWLWMHT
jgi:hypothetical protein